MALRDMDEQGHMRVLTDLDHREEFNQRWDAFTPAEQRRIDDDITHKTG